MDRLDFDGIMDLYDEFCVSGYDYPYVTYYYVTDNDCVGTVVKPYKLCSLCSFLLDLDNRDENGKYMLSMCQREELRKRLLDVYNSSENVYFRLLGG